MLSTHQYPLDKPYEGLEFFSKKQSLLLFNSSMIFKKELGDRPIYNPVSAAKSIRDLSSLFKLISILPSPSAAECKIIMDEDMFNWKITFESVASVFINWGADLKCLKLQALEDLFGKPGAFNVSYGPRTEHETEIPSEYNLKLVLEAIRRRAPSDEKLPIEQKNMIVKILTYAAIDKGQRRNGVYFVTAISAILESYGSWDSSTIVSLVNVLNLRSLSQNNAVQVACTLFHSFTDRLRDLALMAETDLLNCYLGLPYLEIKSLSELIPHLNNMFQRMNRFSNSTIYFIVVLVHNLMVRSLKTITRETVIQINEWAVRLQNACSLQCHLELAIVRERLARLLIDCNNFIKKPNK